MNPAHPTVPGINILIPLMAFCLGLLAGLVVYRHARKQQISYPLLWSGFVGAAFFLSPIILTPFLIPVYYSLFVPSGPGVLVKPVHAVTTVIVGGAIVGGIAPVLYFVNSVRAQRQISETG